LQPTSVFVKPKIPTYRDDLARTGVLYQPSFWAVEISVPRFFLPLCSRPAFL
jgi:hypothetical protein